MELGRELVSSVLLSCLLQGERRKVIQADAVFLFVVRADGELVVEIGALRIDRLQLDAVGLEKVQKSLQRLRAVFFFLRVAAGRTAAQGDQEHQSKHQRGLSDHGQNSLQSF